MNDLKTTPLKNPVCCPGCSKMLTGFQQTESAIENMELKKHDIAICTNCACVLSVNIVLEKAELVTISEYNKLPDAVKSSIFYWQSQIRSANKNKKIIN